MNTTQPVSYAELLERAKGLHEQIRSWRREIHRYPELTFTEQRTASLVNATLADLGIPTETEVAKTGVVKKASRVGCVWSKKARSKG